jgi:hypothetical protein
LGAIGLLLSLIYYGFHADSYRRTRYDEQQRAANFIDEVFEPRPNTTHSSSLYIPDVVNPLERPRTIYQPPTPEPAQEPAVRGHTIYQHALDAIIAANKKVDDSQPIPIDIGFIVYQDTDKPVIYRTRDIPENADAIQPYIQLHVALPMFESAQANISFEIINTSDKLVFSNQQSYTLKDNLNLITPPARLVVSKLDTTDLWELRVKIGDVLLARHVFEWGAASTQDEVAALEADGELSDEMHAMIEEQVGEALSLDDLLMQQADDERKQQKG